uniref:Uncharacterized protein n=1 Tax=Oryza meridionalis TaxID=40149 RepID=A0A0E0CVM4_9ORYZ
MPKLQNHFKKEKIAFDTLVLLVCWMIWKERNMRVFQNQSRTAGFLFAAIKDEAAIWKEAGFSILTRSVLYPYSQGGQLQQAEENNAIKEPIDVN